MCSIVRIPKTKPINKSKINVGRKGGEKDRFTSEISLVDTSDRLTEEYLDRYKGVKSGDIKYS